ncbi:hypothetical protein V2I01_33725 [Micromonospora sp. BRA006-A]|nr:hypothetical protein [Micromonospora sp. BRA006-A]
MLLGQRYDLDWAGADALRRGDPVAPAMLDAERGDPRLEDIALPQRTDDSPSAPWALGLTHNASVDHESFRRVGGVRRGDGQVGLRGSRLLLPGVPPARRAAELFRLDVDALVPPAALPQDVERARLDGQHEVPAAQAPALRRRGAVRAQHVRPAPGRIRLYGQAIEAYRAGGLGRPDVLPASLREELAASAALVVGNGVSTDLGAGSHTFDHDAPVGETNSHLLGTVLQQFKAGALDLIVNVDMWRCLLPEDLPAFLPGAAQGRPDRAGRHPYRTGPARSAAGAAGRRPRLRGRHAAPALTVAVAASGAATVITLR